MPNAPAPIAYAFLRGVNPVIRFLIISDTLIGGAAGLLGPIFALFIEDFIQGGNEAVAGIAAGVYLLARSVFQIPIAHLMDKIKGERDDFFYLFIFSLLVGLMPLFYLIISTPLHLYIVQGIIGLFTAFTFPSYMALFTRHIDRHKEGTEWGLYFALRDITSAILSALGGFIALATGFRSLIIVVAVFSVIGSLMIWPIRPFMKMPRS